MCRRSFLHSYVTQNPIHVLVLMCMCQAEAARVELYLKKGKFAEDILKKAFSQ